MRLNAFWLIFPFLWTCSSYFFVHLFIKWLVLLICGNSFHFKEGTGLHDTANIFLSLSCFCLIEIRFLCSQFFTFYFVYVSISRPSHSMIIKFSFFSYGTVSKFILYLNLSIWNLLVCKPGPWVLSLAEGLWLKRALGDTSEDI